MRRLAFTIFAACSLVLLLAFAGLWVDSVWRDASAIRVSDPRGGFAGVASNGGRVLLFRVRFSADGGNALGVSDGGGVGHERRNDQAWSLRPAETIRFAGFSHERYENSDQAPYLMPFTYVRIVGVPLWFLCLLSAPAPILWVRRFRRNRRLNRDPNLCPHCGYDCRATPERCPECGRAPALRGGTSVPPVIAGARSPVSTNERVGGATLNE